MVHAQEFYRKSFHWIEATDVDKIQSSYWPVPQTTPKSRCGNDCKVRGENWQVIVKTSISGSLEGHSFFQGELIQNSFKNIYILISSPNILFLATEGASFHLCPPQKVHQDLVIQYNLAHRHTFVYIPNCTSAVGQVILEEIL